MIFEDRILRNPRLFRLKDPRTNEIVDFEIQDLLPEEIIQEGTEVGAEELNGQIVNGHSESTSNVYSANYTNTFVNGEVVFEGSTNGTVTLSKSAANATSMEIYFTDQESIYNYVKVDNPQGKKVNLIVGTSNSSYSDFWIKQKIVKISGTSITNYQYAEATTKSDTVNNYNFIYIKKVVLHFN